jgi:hypothetical protein
MADIAPLQLPKQMTGDLSAFLRNVEQLRRVFEVTERCQPASSMWAFAATVAARVGMERHDVLPLLQILWYLRRLQVDRRATAEEAFEIVTRSISELVGRDRNCTTETLARWESAAPSIIDELRRLSGDSPVMITSKAQFLTYQRERILTDARIISDIRPVFGEDGTVIREMVVTNSLVLDYMDDGSQRTVYLTLDLEDLARLREQCERAEIKSRVVVDSLADKPWRTVAFPETPSQQEN